jgi:hypothetical protein
LEGAVAKFPDATMTGRRQTETSDNWKNGMIVVQAASNGDSIVLPCEVKRGKDGKYYTGYYGDVISENSVFRSDKVGLVVGDVHVPLHDPCALDVVDQVARRLNPDYLVNVGDHVNNSALNHHKMDRGESVADEDIVDEFGKASRVLQNMAEWATERHLILGNHERFQKDFTAKYPQLASLLNFHTMSGGEQAGYAMYDEKSVVHVGAAKFVHGEMRNYGATGDRDKKNAQVFDGDVISAHCHNPSSRCGSHHIGLLGKLDQKYNEPHASNWLHGFGVTCHHDDMVFVSNVAIVNYMTFIGMEMIKSGNDVSKWIMPKFRAILEYHEVEDE